MNEKIKAHLTAYCQKNGWGTSDKDLMESISEQKTIHKEIVGSHRWYDDEIRVIEIDGMLLQYAGFHFTGDHSMRDMDLEYDLDSVIEVEKTQRMVDCYIPLQG